jgi:3-phosphoshikimate 1-carboxyvinyltransferase
MEIKEIVQKKVNGVVSIPGSKSYANRALIVAALANGKTKLTNLPTCDDVKLMCDALKLIGVKINEISKTEIEIIPPTELKYDGEIYVGAAGTTMRFLMSLCSTGIGDVVLNGNERMCQRPVEDLIAALETNVDGTITAKNKTVDGERCPPIEIHSKGLLGGKIKLAGNTSSQYLTSILLSSPKAKDVIEIEITGDLTSKSYADMTIDVMKQFGVDVINNDYKTFKVPAAKYFARDYMVESDASGLSYFLAAAAITGGKIRINNVNPNSVQGDIKFIDLLERMGCTIEKGADYFVLEGPSELNAIEVDMNSMPDTAQTLAMLAAVAKGTTKISGISNLRVKETDRIFALKTELAKCGIKSTADDDSITIVGGTPNGAQIKTYDDHRMAMSFAILGLATCGLTVEDPKCVSKSFPEFWELLESI